MFDLLFLMKYKMYQLKIGDTNRLFEIGMKISKLFRGIPVLLISDFNQNKPISKLVIKSLLELIKNQYENNIRTNINNIVSN